MKAAKPVSAILTIGVLVVALSACGVSKPKVNYYQADKQAMSQVLPGLQGTYSDIAKGKITSQEVIALPPKINFAAYVNVECLNGTCTDTYSQKYPEQSYVFTPPLDTCEIIVGTDLTDVDSASFDHYYNVMSTARWGLMSNGQAIGQFCSFQLLLQQFGMSKIL